jgi:hypothetical protein
MVTGAAYSYDGAQTQTFCITVPEGTRVVTSGLVDGLCANAAVRREELSSVKIPDGVEQIGSMAFANCALLQSVCVPLSVTAIARAAFSGCGALTAITLPALIGNIGADAFSGCGALSSVVLSNPIKINECIWNAFGQTKAVIRYNVTYPPISGYTERGGVYVPNGSQFERASFTQADYASLIGEVVRQVVCTDSDYHHNPSEFLGQSDTANFERVARYLGTKRQAREQAEASAPHNRIERTNYGRSLYALCTQTPPNADASRRVVAALQKYNCNGSSPPSELRFLLPFYRPCGKFGLSESNIGKWVKASGDNDMQKTIVALGSMIA